MKEKAECQCGKREGVVGDSVERGRGLLVTVWKEGVVGECGKREGVVGECGKREGLLVSVERGRGCW